MPTPVERTLRDLREADTEKARDEANSDLHAAEIAKTGFDKGEQATLAALAGGRIGDLADAYVRGDLQIDGKLADRSQGNVIAYNWAEKAFVTVKAHYEKITK